MSEGDEGRWVSYIELAAMLNISASAARMHAVRRRWQRRSPNAIGGRAMVLVPADVVVQPRATGEQRTFVAHMTEPNGADQPNRQAIEMAITALSTQLDHERRRADDAVAAERIAAREATALRAELDRRRDWSLWRRLCWALSART